MSTFFDLILYFETKIMKILNVYIFLLNMNTHLTRKSFLFPRASLSEIKSKRPVPTYEKNASHFSRQKT